ncbi:hypothetical protein M422DRAFT_39494 [Sphaerobolus stellatus SS14]|uniref:Uncharacterized protein n=1 Tax=Sphaerobolus stellatus (strain SS14) TaxID=990650 RepID=A0A0C9UDY0_SPHS4|nr:hypothetical protein M422DRAFT_39494 [Sphaerobolus stellatus SS14]
MERPETPPHRAQVSSSFDGDDDRDDDYNPWPLAVHATPRKRRIYGSSMASAQKHKAAVADPNDGKCLLSLQSAPVQACRLVPRRLRGSKLKSLEWWWGLPYNTLNVDTRYNIVFRACFLFTYHISLQTLRAVRPDLHILLDSDYWMLVPDPATIDMIYDLMLEQLKKRRQRRLIYPTTVFTYRLVPLLPMKEVTITRITPTALNPQDPLPQFDDHRYPFANLGPLLSHARPHFALYNAGAKIPPLYSPNIVDIFRQCMQIPTTNAAGSYISKIKGLYRLWTSNAPPDFRRARNGPGLGGGAASSAGSGAGSGPSNPGRMTRSSTSFDAASSHGNAIPFNSQANPGGRQVAALHDINTPGLGAHTMDENHDAIESDNEDDLAHDIAASKKFVSAWWEQTAEAVAFNGGWDTDLCNDHQLGSYVEEHSRSPGEEWHPTWMRRGLPDYHKPPPDTTKFSSNDWSLMDFFIRLPDPIEDIF